MSLPPTRRVLEVALVVLVAVGWVVAYLGARNDLESATPAGRTFLLELFSTTDRIEIGLVLGLIATLALTGLRRWPMPSLVVVTVAVAVAQLRFPMVTRQTAVPELAVATAAFWAATRSARPLLSVLPVAAAGLVVGSLPGYDINPRLDALSGVASGTLTAIGETLLAVLAASLAVAGGMVVRRLDLQSAEAEERSALLDARNAELSAARQEVAERAVEGERIRIARELHDVVAHHVTTMTVHAGAARQLAAGTSEPVTDALQQIENSGRDAVSELHRLLGFLRGGESAPDRAPTPSLRQVDQLVDNAPGGLKIELAIDGDPEPLPTTVDLSAYRIIQEALTNTRKHAAATRAVVRISYQPDAIDLLITDNGRVNDRSGNGTGGLGLVGMRERVALHDGNLEVGPTADGWTVAAHLRYRGAPRVGDDQ